MVISILLKIGTVKFLKNLHINLITKKLFFQIKKLNESNFFLIIIYILIQFKVFLYSPWKLMWSTDIQNTLLLVYWPPHGIAIDHSSIRLKRLTIQLVFIEAWLCVVMRFLHHNTSQVCTATLRKKLKEWQNFTCWLVWIVVVKWWSSVLSNWTSPIPTYPRGLYAPTWRRTYTSFCTLCTHPTSFKVNAHWWNNSYALQTHLHMEKSMQSRISQMGGDANHRAWDKALLFGKIFVKKLLLYEGNWTEGGGGVVRAPSAPPSRSTSAIPLYTHIPSCTHPYTSLQRHP